MLWYRRWTDRQNSIQLYKVGFWGTAVFDALCDIAAERDFGGAVPKEYAEPAFLMRQMNLRPGDSRDEKGQENGAEIIAKAFQAVIACGLVVENECFFLIDGWARRQPKVPKKSTERVRKHRKTLKKTAKKRNENETQVKHNETRFTKFHDVSETHETHNEREKEKERESEKETEKKKPTKSKKSIVAIATGKSRFANLTASLTAAFEAERQTAYLFQGAKDGSALRGLLRVATDAEIMARWTRGLKATGWHQVNTLAQLRQKWNDLATPVVGVTNNPPKPRNEALTAVGGGVETPEQYRKRQAELKRRLTAQGEPLMPELREKWYAKNDALMAAGRMEECDPDYLYKKGIKL